MRKRLFKVSLGMFFTRNRFIWMQLEDSSKTDNQKPASGRNTWTAVNDWNQYNLSRR